jgi:hypothetical protein
MQLLIVLHSMQSFVHEGCSILPHPLWEGQLGIRLLSGTANDLVLDAL